MASAVGDTTCVVVERAGYVGSCTIVSVYRVPAFIRISMGNIDGTHYQDECDEDGSHGGPQRAGEEIERQLLAECASEARASELISLIVEAGNAI